MANINLLNIRNEDQYLLLNIFLETLDGKNELSIPMETELFFSQTFGILKFRIEKGNTQYSCTFNSDLSFSNIRYSALGIEKDNTNFMSQFKLVFHFYLH